MVFRSLEFSMRSSIGWSPSLVIIAMEDDVAFRVCYGGEDDDFDSTFGMELAGKICNVFGDRTEASEKLWRVASRRYRCFVLLIGGTSSSSSMPECERDLGPPQN